MAATPTITAPSLRAVAVGSGPSDGTKVYSLAPVVVYNRHSNELRIPSFTEVIVAHRTSLMSAASLHGLVVAKGKVQSPFCAAWTFTLDGHEYYVLQLPTQVTLVLDIATNKWYIWGTGTGDLWKARIGLNWNQVNQLAYEHGSDIVVGDDSNGALYFLDPDYPVDDASSAGFPVVNFQRTVYGQVPIRGLDAHPCYGVTISGSLGYVDDDQTSTAISLSISDDQGHTFADQGTQYMVLGQYNQRLYWGSLGSMIAPGRLFKVVDYGGIHRIDGLDMDDPDEETND